MPRTAPSGSTPRSARPRSGGEALRETLLLPLDDLLAVTREFIHPEVSRSGLDRCLRRHGVSNLSGRQVSAPHAG